MHSNYLRILIIFVSLYLFRAGESERCRCRWRRQSTPIKMHKIRFYSYKIAANQNTKWNVGSERAANDIILPEKMCMLMVWAAQLNKMKNMDGAAYTEILMINVLFASSEHGVCTAEHLANICNAHFITFSERSVAICVFAQCWLAHTIMAKRHKIKYALRPRNWTSHHINMSCCDVCIWNATTTTN